MNRRKSYPDFILGNYLHKKCDLYESFDFFWVTEASMYTG